MSEPSNMEGPAGVFTRQEFGQALTLVRERAGLTVREVAKAAGVPVATIGGYFSGRHVPPVNTLLAVLRTCGVTDQVPLGLWREAQSRVRRAPGPQQADAVAPYRGLASYQPEDAGWFFGREELTSLAMRRIAERHATGDGLFMVVGPSGAGKSSLLRAGLVPALRAGQLPVPGSPEWPVLLFTPGVDPPGELRRRLEAIAATDAGLVVVVDQFEELFTAGAADDEQLAFVQTLGDLATAQAGSAAGAGPAVVLLGLRADFYGKALRYPRLARALQDAQIVVGPMTEAELRRAIVEPARKANIDIEPGLAELLLRDVEPAGTTHGSDAAHEAGGLPQLSHALLATWERGQRKRLTVAGYRASGGLRGAIAHSAEAVYTTLTEAEQDLARRLFLRLVRLSPDGPDTRRRISHAELVQANDQEESTALADVLDRFIANRLVTASAASVEISHEALLAAWPRVQDWIDADRAGLLIGQKLVDAAQVWDEENRDNAALYAGARLAAAREWAHTGHTGELSNLAREFLQVSTRRERRGVHRLYQTIAGLTVLLVLAAGGWIVAAQQQNAATDERNRAISRLVATRADRIRDKDVSLAMQLSLAAYQIAPTPEARAAVLDSSATFAATRLLGSTGVMQSVAFSPDKRLLAAGTGDKTILIWDVSNRRRPTRLGPILTGPSDVVYSVAFSPDGHILAAGSGDNRIHLWDVHDPARPVLLGTPLTGPNALVYSVAFSPDGHILAAGSGDKRVHLWDMREPRTPKPLGTLDGATNSVHSVVFSPSGRILAAGSADTTIRLWDMGDPNRPAALGAPLTGPSRTVRAVAFSPDETTIAGGSDDSNVYLWSITNPARPVPFAKPLAGTSGWAQAVAFSPDGSILAAGMSGAVSLWDWQVARLTSLLPQTGPVTSVAFADGKNTLATSAADGIARLWALDLPGPMAASDGKTINNIRFSANGAALAVAGGETRLWTTATHEPLSPPITNQASNSSAVALTPDAKTLIVSDREGNLHVWDVTDPQHPVRRGVPTAAHDKLIEQIALSPDATILATASDDTKVRLWDMSNLDRPRLLRTLDGFTKLVYSVEFGPGGHLLAAASVDKTVRIWDVSNPAQPTEITKPLIASDHYALAAVFSPDGKTLAVGSADRNIYLWDITNPNNPTRLGPPLAGPTNYVYALAYSPDGRILAAANTDATLWLWDMTNRNRPTVLATLTVATGALYTVAFQPDGKTFAAAGAGKTVWHWRTDPDQIADQICAIAGDPITEHEWQQYIPDLPYQPPCPH